MFRKKNLFTILIISGVEWILVLSRFTPLSLEKYIVVSLVWCFFAWNLINIFKITEISYVIRMMIPEGDNGYRRTAFFIISFFGLVLIPSAILLGSST